MTIIVDFVHVLEYLWNAAACVHPAGDPAAETWVHQQAHRILEGHATKVAGVIRRKATTAKLDAARRKPADDAAAYLTNKARYLDYPTALADRDRGSSRAPADTPSKTAWTSPEPAGDSRALRPS